MEPDHKGAAGGQSCQDSPPGISSIDKVEACGDAGGQAMHGPIREAQTAVFLLLLQAGLLLGALRVQHAIGDCREEVLDEHLSPGLQDALLEDCSQPILDPATKLVTGSLQQSSVNHLLKCGRDAHSGTVRCTKGNAITRCSRPLMQWALQFMQDTADNKAQSPSKGRVPRPYKC